MKLLSDYIKESFKGNTGPSVGTKVAKYPELPQPELVRGQRERTETGDQVGVLTNGRYKSALRRVMINKIGSRLSIATFYNPASEAIISPAPKLLYPNHFRLQDYQKLYATTKFSDKGLRFESMKMANVHLAT
ncbi:1-aminocyclopropane-1-carboxylate oxidase 1 [Tripterygium wilfordii]|uniref:1-aminocyclopropane-1-carboxylate oxidase 1 n=1 Tax=Tripterygium wilfordii TaxID=458696 RepID=A0A7J7BW23_TRIWF|nr:1-aminocyclopropane-1-carboxylate oxidase 1 [Tripterygium wilfordii]